MRLLASRIPPELFEDILFYVNVDRDSQESLNYLERKSGTPSPNDTLTDLKQCSLVCLFWANKCREHMFSEKNLNIKSYEDAEIFRRYAIGGCPRLTPVHQLIREIHIIQDYQTGMSFLHLLCLSVIRDKLGGLFIEGPVPGGFNPAKLDTPHWGIPTSYLFPENPSQTRFISAMSTCAFPAPRDLHRFHPSLCDSADAEPKLPVASTQRRGTHVDDPVPAVGVGPMEK